MELPINAAVECADGLGGHSVAIILHPDNNEVTHIVVREAGLFGVQRVVPISLVAESSPHAIRLRCTTTELMDQPPFITTRYIQVPQGFNSMRGHGMFLWPQTDVEPGLGVDQKNIPANELEVHRGAHVVATDGDLGVIEEFVIDPVNKCVTHIVLREGMLWNRQEVIVPVAEIDRIEYGKIYLKLSRSEVEELVEKV